MFDLYGHFLIHLTTQTDNRLRCCTNTGSFPTKFYIPHRLKQSKRFNDEHRNFLYSLSVPIIFAPMQKSFTSVLPKTVYQFPLRMFSKSFQMKLAKQKKSSRDKLSERSSIANFKKTHGSQEETFWHLEKGYNSIK